MTKNNSGRERQKQALIIVVIVMVVGVFVSMLVNSAVQDLFDTTQPNTTQIATDPSATTEDTPTENKLLIPVVVKEIKTPTNFIVEKDNTIIDVLLIGVQTEKNIYNNAMSFVKSLIKEGQIIYLQYDEAQTNAKNQHLCYVWLNNTVSIEKQDDIQTQMLNCILIMNNLGTVKNEYPNSRYEFIFNQLVPKNKE